MVVLFLLVVVVLWWGEYLCAAVWPFFLPRSTHATPHEPEMIRRCCVEDRTKHMTLTNPSLSSLSPPFLAA